MDVVDRDIAVAAALQGSPLHALTAEHLLDQLLDHWPPARRSPAPWEEIYEAVLRAAGVAVRGAAW